MIDRREQRLDQLAAEARYHRQRADLYRARLYGNPALSRARLEQLEHAAERAEARLRHARGEATVARKDDAPLQ